MVAGSPGPLSAADAVEDLHTLLDIAGIPGPYLLLGASFGGLIAYTHAGTYPDEVVGMVLLDPTLPDEPAFEAEFVPEECWIAEDAWQSATEQMDYLQSYEDAKAVESTLPAVPVTLIATEDLGLPPDVPAEVGEAIRAMQQRLVDRFEPGVLLLADAPHYMEPAIPETIADVVREVAAAAGHPWHSDGEASSPPSQDDDIDRVVDIGGGRGLYLRCTGARTPTVIMEGGDEDTSSSYRFAEADVAAVTRTCVYR